MDKAAPVRNMPATSLSGVPPFHKAKKQAAHKIIIKTAGGISSGPLISDPTYGIYAALTTLRCDVPSSSLPASGHPERSPKFTVRKPTLLRSSAK